MAAASGTDNRVSFATSGHNACVMRLVPPGQRRHSVGERYDGVVRRLADYGVYGSEALKRALISRT